jgi:hypothetical protein
MRLNVQRLNLEFPTALADEVRDRAAEANQSLAEWVQIAMIVKLLEEKGWSGRGR